MFNRSPYELNVSLVSFDGCRGILRTPHVLKDQMINMLRSIGDVGLLPVSVDTVKTSGTIKNLLRRINTGSPQDKQTQVNIK